MNTTKPQHTPTPKLVLNYGMVEYEDGRVLIEPDPQTDKPGELEAIVRAVNSFEEREAEVAKLRHSHEALLDACKSALFDLRHGTIDAATEMELSVAIAQAEGK